MRVIKFSLSFSIEPSLDCSDDEARAMGSNYKISLQACNSIIGLFYELVNVAYCLN